jgi:mRNA-degrading endonuclease YafQ of YafQ-DinJ toxin-antitoxin module
MRKIFASSVFSRRLRKFLAFHPELKKDVIKILSLLQTNIDSPKLHTHKLHGKMNKSYACSINFQYRLVFSYDETSIYPEYIGSHDEVY